MKKKRKGRNSHQIRHIFMLVIAGAFLSLCLIGYRWLKANRISGFSRETEVYVFPDATLESILPQIYSAGPSDLKMMQQVFKDKKVSQYLTPGHYVIKPKYTYVFVARMLNNGWQSPVSVNFSGNLRLPKDIAACLGKQLLVPKADILEALGDEDFLSGHGMTTADFYCYLLPDTYEMYWTASLDDVFDIFRKAYVSFWNSGRDAKAAEMGFTRLEVSTLASIVNCESNHTEEYPLIAGTYINRMKAGERLQACPTVAFCYDFTLNRILDRHLKVDSPYNTYTHSGLPPGPICCPTKEAIDAVLDAQTSQGYRYFCASPEFNGTHRFAKTYKEHLANGRAYKAELDRRHKEKLLKERQGGGE